MSNQISTAPNLQAPDLSGTRENAPKYFNNYFQGDFSIGLANDIIVAYFEKYTGNRKSGEALAATVLYTAKAQNIDPMAVFDEFKKLEPGQLNNYLAAYLNFNRVQTSTIGIKTTNTTSPMISRTILP